MTASSLPTVLRERASLQPNDPAFTFVDYEKAVEGVHETLTWGQLYRRAVNLAHELSERAQPGDRAVIVAPQGLDYLVAFLGSLQAGLIAVPLSTPMPGVHDERISAVLRDSAPTVVLTTSSIGAMVAEYAAPEDGETAAALIEVDLLDLESRRKSASRRVERPETAYLQYTSGSTRTPAGVMVSYRNLSANFEQIMASFLAHHGGIAPPGTTAVTWLPFYHDMGLLLGVFAPILGGWQTVFTTPLSFLARPARWMQLVASNPHAITAGPNFAFELAAGKTSDEDMAGYDLGGTCIIISGSERVHDATLKRFAQRFRKFNLPEEVLRPAYGLAEATLYVATDAPEKPPTVVRFEPEKLSAGHAKRCASETGTALVSYGTPDSPAVRIVDPQTRRELSAGAVGEIWVRGENVCLGYWRKPEQTEEVFNAFLDSPSAGTDSGPWLRTGDLGFISDDELFIMGRLKDLLIVRGRNHYPDDIEGTIQEISGGRVAAISVEQDRTEQLVAIVEAKKRGDTAEDVAAHFADLKNRITSAISTAHGISAADLVLVPRGSIPITTSGKVRRASCAELYRDGAFTRLDA
ncbi:AMP-binding protein [Mycolicibacterium litorale]|uniref:Acyl-CoA synthetase n=1 Tax=Mycolicibacterium litorale TaxID=758802 RepID=A0AAD1IIU7_9MYCO|nr:AMP-binding protein [Mycolicibacterium litorale]MCV7414245.1 AMP-binding protein [Mycolicibacterium litorale]TDY02065.1 acyl-CoA synthetase (AMP-forming)/AMP-acid ligase II [Mycolicibacterium litorale]BBY15566.1 acyl-CoA synthetase [Mycolicibacterium litorale]